jgi:serine/threonine-protein kinase
MTDQLARLQAALGDRYRIERELGSGGMAVVYLADDLKHHRPVALKVLKPELATVLGPERFLREIEIAAQLHHPHILPLYDSGEADGFLFYVMPYEEGRSLRDRLRREGELPVEEAVRVLCDVADALSHAHEHGVVHRDIKPENILLSGHHALVTDFGVAKAVSDATGRHGLTTTGVALGTPAYMAPEQAAADPHVDQRADIYALGVVAYELLAGRPPFSSATPQGMLVSHLTESPKPVTAYRPSVPPALGQAIMRCLEKNRADRWQSAEELRTQFEAMLTPSGGVTPVGTGPVRTLSRSKWRVVGAIAVAGVVLAVTVGVWLRGRSAPHLDPTLLAVAPFDVLSPDRDLEVWREGVMDLLARSLDGAGPIRTVAPTVAAHRWSGRADATSAEEFGRETGAGLAVFGTLVAVGSDSARLVATLLDVGRGAVLSEQEVRDRADRVDRLVDSLSVRLLGALSEQRAVGAMRLHSVGSSVPAAIKAFLQGQQHYRRSNWDSARAYFAQAIALDSTFALAHRGIGQVEGWTESGVGTAELRALEIRAGNLNHGLAPRESLLILADSLWAGLTPDFDGQWSRLDRLFRIVEEAARRYPEDPEVWYELGEARYHFGTSRGVTAESIQSAFRRALALDSGFVPAYIHTAELAFMTEGRDAGERTLAGILAAHPTSVEGEGALLSTALLNAGAAQEPAVTAMLDTTSAGAFRRSFDALQRLPDSTESALRVARAWAERFSDGTSYLRWMLAFRGHVGDASAEFAGEEWREPIPYWSAKSRFGQLALLGAFTEDTVQAVYADWLESGYEPAMYVAVRWWANRGDTASLARAVRESEVRQRSGLHFGAPDSAMMEWGIDCFEAYLALARGDTADALHRFGALRQWPTIPRAYQEQLTYAQVLAAIGRDEEAATVLANVPDVGVAPGPAEVVWVLERARVNDRLGRRESAVRDYAYVVDVWRNADPLLQPFVEEARSALARLVGEPRR